MDASSSFIGRYYFTYFICLTLVLWALLHPRTRTTVIDLLLTDPYQENSVENKGSFVQFSSTPNSDSGRPDTRIPRCASLLGITVTEEKGPLVLPYIVDLDIGEVFRLAQMEHHYSENLDGYRAVQMMKDILQQRISGEELILVGALVRRRDERLPLSKQTKYPATRPYLSLAFKKTRVLLPKQPLTSSRNVDNLSLDRWKTEGKQNFVP